MIGAIRYSRERLDIDNSRITLLSRRLGTNSVLVALSRRPKEFDNLAALVAVRPVALRALAGTALAQVPGSIGLLESEIKHLTGFDLDELSASPTRRM
ncbi:hypothetical protein [Streptomyces sp. NPDC059278]|uniref:hypothetical protein n=1 Tax=Streptomyces sp. NPDC059278 TaxID=3346801 RepID=UPI0036C17474